MAFDFDAFRRNDLSNGAMHGTIDMIAAYRYFIGSFPPAHPKSAPCSTALDFLKMLEEVRPVRSRQVAALALAQALLL